MYVVPSVEMLARNVSASGPLIYAVLEAPVTAPTDVLVTVSKLLDEVVTTPEVRVNDPATVTAAASETPLELLIVRLLNADELEPPIVCELPPLNVIVELPAVNVLPLLDQFPAIECAKFPVEREVPDPSTTFPPIVKPMTHVVEAVPESEKLPPIDVVPV